MIVLRSSRSGGLDPSTRAHVGGMILDLLDAGPRSTREIADALPAPSYQSCWHDGCTDPRHTRTARGFPTSLAKQLLDGLATNGLVTRSFGPARGTCIVWSLPLAVVPDTIEGLS